ncbi:HlyD family type I secretion periplasmic adaptor subunit [Oricola indica]|jgi:HlyD family type I secretion membrane fusion protein|uniref:HlyD family type I secretion periplasmic adaptor subunit n=1 Tax=Oricola indica TaxID=2872591 RepID=UPI001CBEC04C|nr:HlyD family type I secretion periplasmic adaptor subunit [Oricola indica]
MNAETNNAAWAAAVRTGTSKIALVGYMALILFIGVFGVWAATAPLTGAAIVVGVIGAAGQNQVVQHLEGGIISKIHVHEGDQVSAGDPLFTMDGTRAQASLNTRTKHWVNLVARKARLEAQRDSAEEVTFDAKLVDVARANGLDHVLEEQRDEFRARLVRFESEVVILNQRVAAGEEAIVGFKAQKKALEDQLAVVSDETERKEKLLDQGLTNRSEYTALLRSQADLIGQIGAITSQMEQTRSRTAEAREQLVRQKSQRVEQSLTELNDVSASIGEIEEQLSAAEDVLARVVVRAPSDGLIIRINQNTPGNVVGPGEELARLLPTSNELIVEAQLSPADVDIVRPGQQAELRFVALNMRTTPQVPGTVTYVSPDRLVDPKNGQPYFIARLRITDDLPSEVDRSQIYPGMPVEAMISSGDRTFFEYLLRPLTDSFSRAFREQ